MSDAPLLVIAAGGTGGHMFPAQSLAETMLERGWRVKLSTDARGARYSGSFPKAVEQEVVQSATFARGGLFAKLAVPFRLLSGVVSTARAMRRDRPRAVVGFGGYPSIPALAAAWQLGLPRMIHEQNGVLGRVNKLFAKRVSAVACGVWPTELPSGVTGIRTGNPVRQTVLERAGSPYIPPGDYPMSVLVFGGSQGARILSDIVPAGIAALPDSLRQHLRVAQQAREEDLDRVRLAYAEMGIPAEVAPFFGDIANRLADAQLVISRAGASSVADISVVGRPSILIPYAAAAGDHQSANARMLTQVDAAIRITESQLSAATLAETITAVLGNPGGAVQMHHAALQAGMPDAARDLADLVEALGSGHAIAPIRGLNS